LEQIGSNLGEASHQRTNPAVKIKTSATALWSLMCGIAGFLIYLLVFLLTIYLNAPVIMDYTTCIHAVLMALPTLMMILLIGRTPNKHIFVQQAQLLSLSNSFRAS
jgi:hypothetical protein